MTKKTLYIDMDGVIVDTSSYHYKSWVILFKSFRIKYTKKEFKKDFGKTSRAIIKEHLSKHKIKIDEEKVRYLDRKKERIFRKLIREKIKKIRGVIELMEELKKRKIKMARIKI